MPEFLPQADCPVAVSVVSLGAAQAIQAVCPVVSVYSSAGQSSQAVAPAAEKVPAGQSEHTPPAVLNCPATHWVQPTPGAVHVPEYPAAHTGKKN